MEAIAARAQFAVAGEGPQVAIFPEGTTTNGTYLLNFKIGAFKPGLPVQPVHFDYNDPLLSWTVGRYRPAMKNVPATRSEKKYSENFY